MGHADPEIRKILGDLRFRAALSHALDRNQIKETIMRGTGRVAQFATDRGGPYYEEGMEEAYAAYDPEKAKQLLDDLGLVDADGDGWRDRLDGEPFLFIFEYPQVQAPLAGADFAKRYWEAIGIRVDVKETSGGAYAKVRNAYENMVTMWHAAGTVTPIDPWFLGGAVANVSWNHWYNTNGEKGIEPPQWYVTIRDSQKAYWPRWTRRMRPRRRRPRGACRASTCRSSARLPPSATRSCSRRSSATSPAPKRWTGTATASWTTPTSTSSRSSTHHSVAPETMNTRTRRWTWLSE